MIAHKILFPTDFSELSHEALAMATTLARDNAAPLVVLHVGQPMAFAAGEFYAMNEPDWDAFARRVEHVQPADPAVPCTHRIETGDPAAAIVRVAQEEGCDLIVMATHGRRGLSRLMMGSVAEEVIRKAPCPVLTVKHSAPAVALA